MRHRSWKCTAAIALTMALTATGCGTTAEGGAAEAPPKMAP